MEAVPLLWARQNKRLLIAVFCVLNIGVMLYVWQVQKEPDIAPFLALPLIFLVSSLIELHREKKNAGTFYHFEVPEHSYDVEKRLGMNVVIKPVMKSTTGILWDGKLIIMPQSFSSEGEALSLTCEKAQSGGEVYYCRGVSVHNPNTPIGKRLLSIWLTVSLLALPACLYLGKGDTGTAGYWEALGGGFGTCLIFGFARLALYGEQKNLPVRLMRAVMDVMFALGLLALAMAVAGIYSQ